MRRPRLCLALILLTALLATGCGSSSTPQAASVPVAPATTTPSATTPPAPTTTTQATTTTTTTTTTKPATRTSSAPTKTTAPTTSTATATTPLPAAPSGLKAATGYSSYDNCRGTCTGSVPASLRRALRLPGLGAGGACPVSGAASTVTYAGPAVGSGPVYAAQPSPFAITPFISSTWKGGRVTWVAAPSYTGPLLIRGAQVGGSGAVGFGEGHAPVDEIQALTPATTSPGEPSGAREWPSFTRMHAAGCYAYQVDGTNFSEAIVFQATG